MRKKRKRGGEEGRKGKEGERGERKEREKDLRVLKWRRGRARGDSTIVLVILLCAFREVTLGMASLCPWASPISKHFFSCRRSIGTFGQCIRVQRVTLMSMGFTNLRIFFPVGGP